MIKKIVLVVTFFIFNNANSQNKIIDSTKYKIVYNLIYQQDSTDITSKREEKMVLFIGKKYSLFQSENSRFNDSLKKSFYNSKNDIQIVVNSVLTLRRKSRFNFKILKSPNTILVFDKIFSDKFIYKDEEKLNWKILNETKQINNYLCQKATTHFAGRDYVAWFTNKIPINDGPYKFRGLPGLIIKIQDTKKQYNFELLSFKKYNSSFSFDVKGIQMVTKKAYFKAYNDFKSNFIEQLEQRGITFDKSNASQVNQSIRKRRNNEIEID